jgi:hypothetical protein
MAAAIVRGFSPEGRQEETELANDLAMVGFASAAPGYEVAVSAQVVRDRQARLRSRSN